ncbi:dTDP-4-amino-4,6-dideoxy-D-glucose transaminase [anaerobic digester metagenome]
MANSHPLKNIVDYLFLKYPINDLYNHNTTTKAKYFQDNYIPDIIEGMLDLDSQDLESEAEIQISTEVSNENHINVTLPDLPDINEYVHYLEEIWDSKWLTNDGQFVQLLEKKLKEFMGLKKFLLVSNGTLALQIALKVLNIKGSVITTPFTFAATTNSLLWEGLNPIFADIHPETFNIDPRDVERKITPDTSAIMAVHTYGNPCDVEVIEEIAEDKDLMVIYDGAHAFNVQYKNRSIFSYGDISTLSFHATKAFHTIEGGALVTHDLEVEEKIKLIRNHGIDTSLEEVILPGTNAKMNEFQAIMGLCNLKNIEKNIQIRKLIYECYVENLQDLDVKFQKIQASQYNYAYMPVCFEDEKTRNQVQLTLSQRGYYPRKYFYPLTADFEYFKNKSNDLNRKYDLKTATDVSNSILCLPLYPTLSLVDTYKIINIIREVVS